MVTFSKDFIDSVKARLDIVDVIDKHVPLKKSGSLYEACCPFHEEKTPSFKVYPDTQSFNCFGECGVAGDIVDFIERYNGVNFSEAIKELAQRANLELPKEEGGKAIDKVAFAKAFSMLKGASNQYQSNLASGGNNPERQKATAQWQSYLSKRGVSRDTAKEFGLGVAYKEWGQVCASNGTYKEAVALAASGLAVYKPKTDTTKAKLYDFFREGLIFPIHNERGAIVSFAKRRAEGADGPKYVNGKDTILFTKSDVVYGLHHALTAQKNNAGKNQAKRNFDDIIVSEGYLDVIASHQAKIFNSVCGMGTAFSESQVRRLMKHTSKVVFCFDGDAAGVKASKAALITVSPLANETTHFAFVKLPTGHDPDSFIKKFGGKAYVQYVTDHQVPFSQFLLQMARGDESLTNAESRALMFNRASVLLDAMPASGFKAQIMTSLERITNIHPREMLPISLNISDEHLKNSSRLDIETEIKTLIAARSGIDAHNISLSINTPTIERSSMAPYPPAKGDMRGDLGSHVRDVSKILNLDIPVNRYTTLETIVRNARQGTGEVKAMALGSLESYVRQSTSIPSMTKALSFHGKQISELIGEDLDNNKVLPEQHAKICLWAKNTGENAGNFSALVDMLPDAYRQISQQELGAFLSEMNRLANNDHNITNQISAAPSISR